MAARPTIKTERLHLRPFTLADAADVRRLAGEREIALNTLSIPHPYADGIAEKWIGTHQLRFDEGKGVEFAIERSQDRTLVGAIGLAIGMEHNRGEIGYWIGKPYWGSGYATEAAAAVLRYGFETLDLNRIFACYFLRNPVSARVLQKLGMTEEGTSREHIRKWGEFVDIGHYAILRSEYDAQQPRGDEPIGNTLL